MSKVDFAKLKKSAEPERHTWWAVAGKPRPLDVIEMDGRAMYRPVHSNWHAYRRLDYSTFREGVFTTRREALAVVDPGKRKTVYLVDYEHNVTACSKAPSGNVYDKDGRFRSYREHYVSKGAALKVAIAGAEREAKRLGAQLAELRKKIRKLKSEAKR